MTTVRHRTACLDAGRLHNHLSPAAAVISPAQSSALSTYGMQEQSSSWQHLGWQPGRLLMCSFQERNCACHPPVALEDLPEQ